jgi:hypothetical protein
MAGELKKNSRFPALITAALACAVLAGCSTSLGGLGKRGAVAAAQGTAAPVQPTALMEAAALPPPPQPTPAAQAAAAVPGTTATSLFPTGTAKDTKLLSPEEKAAVIAELEALAKNQKVVPPSQQRAVCDDPSLDPAERQRRENEGIAC